MSNPLLKTGAAPGGADALGENERLAHPVRRLFQISEKGKDDNDNENSDGGRILEPDRDPHQGL